MHPRLAAAERGAAGSLPPRAPRNRSPPRPHPNSLRNAEGVRGVRGLPPSQRGRVATPCLTLYHRVFRKATIGAPRSCPHPLESCPARQLGGYGMKRAQLAELFLLAGLAGCSLHQQAGTAAAPGPLPATPSGPSSKISHIVIIVQENRSVDNLFHGLPGADTADYGLNSEGEQVTLQPDPLAGSYDISHAHAAFETEYANGQLNGFNLVQSHCSHRGKCPPRGLRAYAYVPQSDVQPYFTMAEQYAFADQMFQTNQGPSFPAHQYLMSGTSTISAGSTLRAAENPKTPTGAYTGGCDSPVGSLVALIDQYGNENQQAYPCFDRPALSDLVEAKSLSWHYYQAHPGAGLWNGPDAILHIRDGGDYRKHVSVPPAAVINDITYGRLANVVWV